MAPGARLGRTVRVGSLRHTLGSEASTRKLWNERWRLAEETPFVAMWVPAVAQARRTGAGLRTVKLKISSLSGYGAESGARMAFGGQIPVGLCVWTISGESVGSSYRPLLPFPVGRDGGQREIRAGRWSYSASERGSNGR